MDTDRSENTNQETQSGEIRISKEDCVPEAVMGKPINGTEMRYLNETFLSNFLVSDVKFEMEDKEIDSPYAEVIFKCKRRVLYKNPSKLKIVKGEFIIVEVDNGVDIGTITGCGAGAMEKFNIRYACKEPEYSLVRHVSKEDFEKFSRNRSEEGKVVDKTRELVKRFNLDMKVTESEWQFDRQRLTIYFTAPQRIDFRELVKELAKLFKTRIELRQISTREEAKRLGGLGPCGRALCCSSWNRDFNHITLDHARTQQLSNNVAKLSGYCGRLKCCLLYEIDTYKEAFSKYPPLHYLIKLPEGIARIIKVDIFKDVIYLGVNDGTYKSINFEELEKLVKEGKTFPPKDDDNIKPKYIYEDADDEDLKQLEDN